MSALLAEISPPSARATPRPRPTAFALQNRFVIFLLLAAPALMIGLLVFRYGTDVPWGDEWDDMPPLLSKYHAGVLQLADFFAFHNEHRILFPRLISFPLALFTKWNVRAELFVIWFLALLCALNFWRIAVVTGLRGSKVFWPLLFVSNLFFFTALSWENFLWGFQIGFLLPLVCLTALPWVARAGRWPWNFLGALALCLVTNFSIASGFQAWLLATPLLFFLPQETKPRRPIVAAVIWFASALASVIFYFRGFKAPTTHPNAFEMLRQPAHAWQFICAYLGRPFAPSTPLRVTALACPIGAIFIFLFVLALVYVWQTRDAKLCARTGPWFALGTIALFSSGVTMLGRSHYGLAGALPSRYVIFSLQLPISLLFLSALILPHLRARARSSAKICTIALLSFCAALIALLLITSVQSLGTWRSFRSDRLAERATFLLGDILDQPTEYIRYAHWNGPLVREDARALAPLGYLRPAPLSSARLRPIAQPPSPEVAGELQHFRRLPNDQLLADGWAILVGQDRAADCIVFTYENREGEPIIFARANVILPRPEMAERFGDAAFQNSGWSKTWSLKDLPAEAKAIGVWALDAERVRAYPIGRGAL